MRDHQLSRFIRKQRKSGVIKAREKNRRAYIGTNAIKAFSFLFAKFPCGELMNVIGMMQAQ